MDNNILHNLLMFALPGGFIGSVISWIAGRRKQKNDMLGELQSSINMLSTENKEILHENVLLRRENADLKANQEEMILRIDRLTKEVERLRKAIGKRKEYENNTPTATARTVSGGMRLDPKDNDKPNPATNGLSEVRPRRISRRKPAAAGNDGQSVEGKLDPKIGNNGVCTGAGDSTECNGGKFV